MLNLFRFLGCFGLLVAVPSVVLAAYPPAASPPPKSGGKQAFIALNHSPIWQWVKMGDLGCKNFHFTMIDMEMQRPLLLNALVTNENIGQPKRDDCLYAVNIPLNVKVIGIAVQPVSFNLQHGGTASTPTPTSTTTMYTYDAAGRLLTTTVGLPNGGTPSPAARASPHATSPGTSGGGTTRYTYDAPGRIVRTVDPLGTLKLGEYDKLVPATNGTIHITGERKEIKLDSKPGQITIQLYVTASGTL